MIVLEVGHASGIEGLFDGNTKRFRQLPGEVVTVLVFPTEMTFAEMMQGAVTALSFHVMARTKPVWIVSNSSPLTTYLIDYFTGPRGRADTILKHKPPEWGILERLPEEDPD